MRPQCRKLHKNNKFITFILDDESYFTLSNSTLAGNDCYYSNDVASTPDEIKHKLKEKYESKGLVWIAISSQGVSQPFFAPYIFWQDLASSHYAHSVLNHLRKEKINFVEKVDNPANVPEAQPIEDFWADLKCTRRIGVPIPLLNLKLEYVIVFEKSI